MINPHYDPHPFQRVARPATPRRRAAAQRAIRREKERLPLFADQFEQTTDERLAEVDEMSWQTKLRQRNWRAYMIKAVRRVWRAIPINERARIAEEWKHSAYPKEPGYLVYFLRQRGWCTEVGELRDGRFVVTIEPINKSDES